MDFERYETDVVRLMYDYASSVVWFPDPIPHTATGLSAGVVADLDSWVRLHEEHFHYADGWGAPEHQARAEHEQQLLAHRIGDELGSAFEVEFDVPPDVGFGPRHASYRSEAEATNPAAAAAFSAMADAHREERDFWRQEAAASRGDPEASFGWYAVSPQSGGTFIPSDHDDPREPEDPEDPHSAR